MMSPLFILRHPLWVFVSLILFALVAMPGCSVLPIKRPAHVYLLPGFSAAVADELAVTPLPLSLRVNRPLASGILAGRHIAVVPAGHRIQVYADSLWNTPPPLMLRDRLLEMLRKSGRYAALSSDEKVLFADYELDSDLHAFQSAYQDGRPQVLIALDVRLVDATSRRIVGSHYFKVVQPAASEAVDDVVGAFGQSADQLATEVAEWLQGVLVQ